MNKVNLWLSLLLVVSIMSACRSQQDIRSIIRKDVPVTMDGYLINLYGESGVWIFQPCKDSNLSVFQAIDGQSFYVQDMVNDLGYTHLKDIYEYGNKKSITYYDVTNRKEVVGEMLFLFCRLTIYPIGLLSKQPQCDYLIYHNGKKSGLSCLSFENYVKDLEPIDVAIRKKYLQGLHEKKMPLPSWFKE